MKREELEALAGRILFEKSSEMVDRKEIANTTLKKVIYKEDGEVRSNAELLVLVSLLISYILGATQDEEGQNFIELAIRGALEAGLKRGRETSKLYQKSLNLGLTPEDLTSGRYDDLINELIDDLREEQ